MFVCLEIIINSFSIALIKIELFLKTVCIFAKFLFSSKIFIEYKKLFVFPFAVVGLGFGALFGLNTI